VFGILKRRFRFFKNFINLRCQKSVDYCFVTCCILHNMLLKADGYLEENLTPFPGGLEKRLARKFRKQLEWIDGFWNRQNDDTVDKEMDADNRRQTTTLTKHELAVKRAADIAALVDHHQYGTTAHN
jgi:hypothetical protein